KEDFQLFDKGKAQAISRFSVESGKGPDVQPKADTVLTADGNSPAEPKAGVAPKRFVEYLFDDVHVSVGNLMRVRAAAEAHLNSLESTDRAAILTTSGQNNLDFTGDRLELIQALRRVQARPAHGVQDCPEVSYYMADQLLNKSDQ